MNESDTPKREDLDTFEAVETTAVETTVSVEVSAEPVTPTQVANPGRTTLRSFVQAVVPLLVAANLAFIAIQETFVEYGVFLPAWASAALNGAIVGTSLLTALLARIMAIPGVNDFLSRHAATSWLAPKPTPLP